MPPIADMGGGLGDCWGGGAMTGCRESSPKRSMLDEFLDDELDTTTGSVVSLNPIRSSLAEARFIPDVEEEDEEEDEEEEVEDAVAARAPALFTPTGERLPLSESKLSNFSVAVEEYG